MKWTYMKYARFMSTKLPRPTGLEKLVQLRKVNEDKDFVNKNLKDIISDIHILIAAYSNIKSKPGNMTPGIDGDTLDGISKQWFEATSRDIATGAFKFKPSRKVEIPKANGKTRTLGIPSPKDKVIQEAIRMILEIIYEPTFHDSSHGFRTGKGCHSAINYIRIKFGETKWFVEGDIAKCFDSFDHKILINKLQTRISDQVFLDLIRKAIKAGYVDVSGIFSPSSDKGTPQGSIISPILSNILLTELDIFMEGLQKEFHKGTHRKANPEYNKRRKSILHKNRIDKRTLRNKSIEERNAINTTVPGEMKRKARILLMKAGIQPYLGIDPSYRRLRYIRYADDFLIGIIGSKEEAIEIRNKVLNFLKEDLKLDLNLDKTKITHATKDRAHFLGYELHSTPIAKRPESRVNGKLVTTVPRIRISAPISKLIKKLLQGKYCRDNNNPTRCGRLIHYTEYQIVEHYSLLWRGIANYYVYANNFSRLNQVYYILYYSCVLTLASKLNLKTKRKVISRMTKLLLVKDPLTNEVVISFPKWGKPKQEFKNWSEWTNTYTPEDIIEKMSKKTYRSIQNLNGSCSICGSTLKVEMHHIKHLRKNKSKDPLTQTMQRINRKQIPVCQVCHNKIHKGQYSGPKL